MKNAITKKILLLAVVIVILTSTNVFAYAFFNDFTKNDDITINLGDWLDNSIPINTAQEFYDCVTNENSLETDYYYLNNDIDFTDFEWNFSEDVIFRGTLDGNNHTISNLTVSTTDTSVDYFGLFPRTNGATIENLKLDNVNVTMDVNTMKNSNMITGLLVGYIDGGENTFSNIEISNSNVIGSSRFGTGGLIGEVYASDSIINIDKIKTRDLKVFTRKRYVGGLIGYIYGANSEVNISNIDIEVEVFATYTNGYTGGIIGKINSDTTTNINNAIINMNSTNTFVTGYNTYPKKHIGGVAGQNLSSNLTANNIFITGNLVTYAKNYVKYVATFISRNSGSYTKNNVYYSNVLFKQSDKSTDYISPSNSIGIMADLVSASSLPSSTWWNTFYQNFDQTIWSQDETGYINLNI